MSASLAEALTAVRDPIVQDIATGMAEDGFLGITGEPLIGKTRLARRAEAMLEHAGTVRPVLVNVSGAYSIAKLVARWRHALLRAVVGRVAASHAAALPNDFWPSTTTRALLDARDLFGDDYDAALSELPARKDTTKTLARVIELTVEVARRGPCVLIFDQLEAPLLTHKHPVNPGELLWEVRAAAQHLPDLHVAVICHPAAVDDLVAGPENAYYGDGRWVRIPAPGAQDWAVAHEWAGLPFDHELLQLADDHIPTMLLLTELATRTQADPHAVFRLAARAQHEHADRCLLHANGLHRLGAHVLVAVANGDGPYASTPDARSDDVAKAVRQLTLAGLIRRERGSSLEDPGSWRLTDPLVRWLLAEPMNLEPYEPQPDLR